MRTYTLDPERFDLRTARAVVSLVLREHVKFEIVFFSGNAFFFVILYLVIVGKSDCATMQMFPSLAFFAKLANVCFDWLITATEDHLSRPKRSTTEARGEEACHWDMSVTG